MNPEETSTTTETVEEINPFPCDWPGCDRIGPRGFHEAQQLRMHKVKMHSTNSKPPMTREEKLAKGRAYNKKHRARLKRLGVTKLSEAVEIVGKTSYKGGKKASYERLKDRYHAMGLNAGGRPFSPRRYNKGRPMSPETRRKLSESQKAHWRGKRMTPAGRKRISEATKARWANRREAIMNGAAPQPVTQTDNMGESAKAILVAAQVL